MLIQTWNQGMQDSFENFFPQKMSCEERLQKRSLDAITNESHNTSGYIFILGGGALYLGNFPSKYV